jgi:microcystin-dependent protein
MKKSFLVFFFFSISLKFFAQGIAVQGIARDNASSAITDTTLNFTFSITQDDNTVLYAEAQSIRTDNYGVFSHIVKNGNPLNGAVFSTIDFSIQNLKMKVSVNYNSTDIEVYDQTFQYTPYAHFAANAANAANAVNAVNAANGVPTGSIMAFTGEPNEVPAGWALCNGSLLPSNATTLIAMIGRNTPDLGGMFLRGAGTNNLTNVTTALGGRQDDTANLQSHNHNVNLDTADDGQHTHKTKQTKLNLGGGGYGTLLGSYNSTIASFDYETTTASYDSRHSHNVAGFTASTGNSSETRPVNYGVNYIIKL